MRLVDINPDCYAHLIKNTIYLYVDNECVEVLYVNDIEYIEDPIPYIMHELELASRGSLFESINLLI